MSCSHLCTLMLIALSCYCLTQTKASPALKGSLGHNDQQQAKTLDSQKPLSPESYMPTVQHQQQQQQRHAPKARLADEKRPKRSQHDMSEYKDLNDIIDELEENTLMQAAAAAAAAASAAYATTTAPPAALPGSGYMTAANLNSNKAQAQEFDFENMPPLTYYLLLQKLKQLQAGIPTYRVRTPRLGRSIDFQQLMDGAGGFDEGGNNRNDEEMTGTRQFVSRLIKKSVPFKPRLGKRGQTLCDRND